MAKYLFTYHGGGEMPESEEEQAQVMAAWEKWFEDNGSAVLDAGNPAVRSATIAGDGSVNEGAGQVSGYSLFEADSFDAALAIAKGSPMLQGDGSVAVHETIEM